MISNPPASEFTDVPLSLPPEPPVSAHDPLQDARPSADQNEKHETEQDKAYLFDTSSSAASIPSSQDPTIEVGQSSASSQPSRCDPITVSATIEPFEVPSLYPSLPVSAVDPQFLIDMSSIATDLSQTSFMPLPASTNTHTVEQISPAPAILTLADQESSPPSLVPVELDKVEKPQERLYPELPRTCQVVQPFTSEQLRMWEPGSWLENVELHASEFQALVHQEGHELHELLLNYWRCRKQLVQAQTELQATISDCKSAQNRLWSFKDEQLTLQVEI